MALSVYFAPGGVVKTGNRQYRRHFYCAFIALVFAASCAASHSLPDPLKAGWLGESVCEALHEDSYQRILRCKFSPGTGHERHYHVPHFGYAIEGGRMRIIDSAGVREVDLPTGSSFTSEGVAWHEVLNIGGTTVIYLIIERK